LAGSWSSYNRSSNVFYRRRKVMNADRYRSGDIVLFKAGNDILGQLIKIVGGETEHAGIVSYICKDEQGNFKAFVLEALNNGLTQNAYDLDANNICVVRLNKYLDCNLIQNIIRNYYTRKVLNGSAGYSWKGLIDAGINELIKSIFKTYTKKSLLGNEENPFCSEAVTEIYNIYDKVFSNIDDNVVSPNDLREEAKKGNYLHIVKDFK
jgi:hypothetical protein